MVVSRTQIKIILHFLPLAHPSWDSVEFCKNSHVLALLIFALNKIGIKSCRFYYLKGAEGEIPDFISFSLLFPVLENSCDGLD